MSRKYFVPTPNPKKRPRGQVVLYLPQTLYMEVKVAAAQNDLSLSAFCRQCISYAIDSMAWKEVDQQKHD